MEWGHIALEIPLHLESLLGRQNRGAVIPHGSAHDYPVPWPELRVHYQPLGETEAGGGDHYAVEPALGNDLHIASHQLDADPLQRVHHASRYPPQVGEGEALLHHYRIEHHQWLGSHHEEVVYCARGSQPPYVASREEGGLHGVGVDRDDGVATGYGYRSPVIQLVGSHPSLDFLHSLFQ